MPPLRFLITLALMLIAASPFAVSCHAVPTLTVLHTFSAGGPDDLVPSHHANSDGSRPQAPLLQGRDGTWYGTTSSGGANGTGVIFKMNSDGTGFTVLHSFGPLTAFFGNDTNSDGCWPEGALVLGSDGTLYGAASQGGPGGSGTIFKLNPDGSSFALLHSFEPKGEGRRNADGASPRGLAVGPDHFLYGTASFGGKEGHGVIFRITQTGADYTMLHVFGSVSPKGDLNNVNAGGALPSAAVIIDKEETLYGTTNIGGAQGYGIVYRMNADGKNFVVLHNFGRKGSDFKNNGAFPGGTLTLGPNNVLYGATRQGGAFDGGTVFKVNVAGTNFTVLHSFPNPNLSNVEGTLPADPVILGKEGRLYGLTGAGGRAGNGTLFSVSSAGADFAVLHAFGVSSNTVPHTDDGGAPTSPMFGADGELYGVADGGGANGTGTVFRVMFPAAK